MQSRTQVASMLISKTHFPSSTIDFFPLSFEKNPLDNQEKLKVLQDEITRIDQLIYSENNKSEWLQNLRDTIKDEIEAKR